MSQINQISIGLGRANPWGTAAYTYVGDTGIANQTQLSMDSRTVYMISMDYSFRKIQLYQTLSFSVLYPEHKVTYPGKIVYIEKIFGVQVPTFDYSINISLLKPTRRLTLYGGLNFRAQWPVKEQSNPKFTAFYENAYSSVAPFTMGINLNLRYQTRWLRVELGYIGDITSSARDFEYNGQIVNMAPLKMKKVYLVFSGPVFRTENPPKKLKKKDFIKN